ncbi:putative serine/threonine-protein kinase drkA [Balamuthia mandrillaris]
MSDKKDKHKTKGKKEKRTKAKATTAGSDSEQSWEKTIIKSSELQLGEPVAKGTFGTVYKGICRGQLVAIKHLHKQDLVNSHEKVEELKKEVMIMSRLRHPCLLLFMGVCTEPEHLSLVMEFIDGSSLDAVIHKQDLLLTLEDRLKIAKGIAKGCNWLHCLEPPIVHRDLKPANILVDSAFNVKVCDFGLSCIKEPVDPHAPPNTKAVGSPIWMAPEILEGCNHNEASDVYAYGLILWELWTRETPFQGITSFERFCDLVIDDHYRPEITDTIPVDVAGLIRECWHPNPAKRPSFETVITRLNEIIINSLITDESGRKLWKSRKIVEKEAVSDYYPTYIHWDTLINALNAKKGTHHELESSACKCLEAMIATELSDLTTSERKRVIVKAEAFGNFLLIFGPLKGVDIINKFEAVCRAGYFHGPTSAQEAGKRLQLAGANPGDFLVRMSGQEPKALAISKINDERQVQHQRFFKAEHGFVIKINNEPQTYPDLETLIKETSEALGLKRPCGAGSVFDYIFNPVSQDAYISSSFHNIGLDKKKTKGSK